MALTDNAPIAAAPTISKPNRMASLSFEEAFDEAFDEGSA
jgi:hypothetical protein